jgi:GH35 family endo-1,4-beta-xylanase
MRRTLASRLARFACAALVPWSILMSIPASGQPTGAPGRMVTFDEGPGRFLLAGPGEAAPIHVSDGDWAGVVRAAGDLRADVARVTGNTPDLREGGGISAATAVIIGTIGRSALIDELIRAGRLDVSGIEGRWETYLLQVIDRPAPGVDRALVIAGSDKRGTIFGIYHLSEQIGVSPWHFWADVPAVRRDRLYVLPGRHTAGEPGVKYRGIFLNNENPALLGWVNHTFGGFGHEFYSTVFELILRLRGNYLWPAMWGKAFYDDDPRNAEMADLYGVVIGTTHHEPMSRSHVEWARYGNGAWDYQRNTEVLQQFWREGVSRLGQTEATIALGMRGDGDEPMSPEREVELMRRIMADQRRIIAEEMGDPAASTQIWALYKEVQEYYEQGLRPPEDVMILLANDNWGNVRLLPSPDDPHHRAAGYGMYYHFDYVGGPRNYKWINTNQISRIWEQLHMTWQHGVDRMWLVNVGDIKPMEFPISFFLDFAWNPEWMPLERMAGYTTEWAERAFGEEHAPEIAHLIDQYTRFNARRKPELLDWQTYSLANYGEFRRVVEAYADLAEKARALENRLPEEYRDAFHQLVTYPVTASANLNDLYYTVALNHLYARQGRARTNALAERARAFFEEDQALADFYNDEMSAGKWRHMMEDTRIGYTYWQTPPRNVMPPVFSVDPRTEGVLSVAIDGSELVWPHTADTVLPGFDVFNRQTRSIDVFNRGRESYDYTVTVGQPWVHVSETGGMIREETRLQVSIDWDAVPYGRHEVPIAIRGAGTGVVVMAPVHKPASPRPGEVRGFVEANGHVAIEARNYSLAIHADDVHWQEIPGFGRTLSGMKPYPVLAGSRSPGGDSPRLEYVVHLFQPGEVTVHTYVSPTLNYDGGDGLRFGVSINDGPIEVVNMHNPDGRRNERGEVFSNPQWYRWVADNVIRSSTRHTIGEAGDQVLKFWMVDPNVVLQRLVIDTGGLKESYLGPPESYRTHRRNGAAGVDRYPDIVGQPPLKDVFEAHFHIGAAVNDNQVAGVDARGAALTAHHFNTITNENVLKWEEVHPRPGEYAFEAPDRFVQFGNDNDMFVVGHTLVWHSQIPGWVFQDEAGGPISRDALIERMHDHITTIVGRYRGRVQAWDVVNEALNMDGTLRRTPWLEIIGEEYLAMAFRFAHEADPDAELYYNDYSLEHPEKRAGAVRLVQNLLGQGIRVDAVGTQSHLHLDRPTLEQVEATIVELAALGLPVMVTELDVTVLQRNFEGADVARQGVPSPELNPFAGGLPEEMEHALAERYRDLFDIYVRHRDILRRVTFWGVADGDSWLNYWPIEGRTDYPLLFDRQHQPKRAFDAVVEAARGGI